MALRSSINTSINVARVAAVVAVVADAITVATVVAEFVGVDGVVVDGDVFVDDDDDDAVFLRIGIWPRNSGKYSRASMNVKCGRSSR